MSDIEEVVVTAQAVPWNPWRDTGRGYGDISRPTLGPFRLGQNVTWDFSRADFLDLLEALLPHAPENTPLPQPEDPGFLPLEEVFIYADPPDPRTIPPGWAVWLDNVLRVSASSARSVLGRSYIGMVAATILLLSDEEVRQAAITAFVEQLAESGIYIYPTYLYVTAKAQLDALTGDGAISQDGTDYAYDPAGLPITINAPDGTQIGTVKTKNGITIQVSLPAPPEVPPIHLDRGDLFNFIGHPEASNEPHWERPPKKVGFDPDWFDGQINRIENNQFPRHFDQEAQVQEWTHGIIDYYLSQIDYSALAWMEFWLRPTPTQVPELAPLPQTYVDPLVQEEYHQAQRPLPVEPEAPIEDLEDWELPDRKDQTNNEVPDLARTEGTVTFPDTYPVEFEPIPEHINLPLEVPQFTWDVTVGVIQYPDGAPGTRLDFKIRVNPKTQLKRPERLRKDEKNTSERRYVAMLAFINKTYGNVSEVVDFWEILQENTYVKLDGVEIPLDRLDLEHQADALWMVATGEATIRVDHDLIYDLLLNEIEDKAVGQLSQFEKQHMRGAFGDNPQRATTRARLRDFWQNTEHLQDEF